MYSKNVLISAEGYDTQFHHLFLLIMVEVLGDTIEYHVLLGSSEKYFY